MPSLEVGHRALVVGTAQLQISRPSSVPPGDSALERQDEADLPRSSFFGFPRRPSGPSRTPILKPENWWGTTMPNNPKFPGSVEIKRVIAAAIRAGIEIGRIEIHPNKIVIHPREENAPEISDYDIWKLSQGSDTDRVKNAVEDSDALPTKPKR